MTTTPPPVLTIAGSDSGGGAGMQADLKTFAVLGCHGTSAVTAITAQNTRTVRAAELVAPGLIGQQIEAVADDMPMAAAKTGMLGAAEQIEAVAAAVHRCGLSPLVVDPVMVAKSGDPLIDAPAVRALGERLLPMATIVTPNRHEAARLLDRSSPVADVDDAAEAARAICHRYGAAACVVKGIRQPDATGREQAVDVWASRGRVQHIPGPCHHDGGVHGAGCAYSAAIAGFLAHGQTLENALHRAKQFIDTAIAHGLTLGSGSRAVNPLAWQG